MNPINLAKLNATLDATSMSYRTIKQFIAARLELSDAGFMCLACSAKARAKHPWGMCGLCVGKRPQPDATIPSPHRLAYAKHGDQESWQLESHGMLAPRWFASRAEGEAYLATLPAA
jgi:hypothetical protein